MTSTERLTAEDWVVTYLQGGEAQTVQGFASDFASLAPTYRALRGISDRQEWVDGYAHIQWESGPRRERGEPVYTVDADELAQYLMGYGDE